MTSNPSDGAADHPGSTGRSGTNPANRTGRRSPSGDSDSAASGSAEPDQAAAGGAGKSGSSAGGAGKSGSSAGGAGKSGIAPAGRSDSATALVTSAATVEAGRSGADGRAGKPEIDGARPSQHPERERAHGMFDQLAVLPVGPERQRVRDRLVEMHLPLVEYLARRFAGRGEPLDDLVQVGMIGLIKAVDRFDIGRGVEFSTYATPTVVGEIKRHFRDKGWTVRVPRRLQELRASLSSATSQLTQTLGRSPTVAELASHLRIGEEDVLEGLESANAYTAVSIEASDGEGGLSVADTLGDYDESLEGVEYRESIKPLLESLPARERRILLLRFFGNLTQSQIAAELGISQMHVSRLLARTLAQLRERLLLDE